MNFEKAFLLSLILFSNAFLNAQNFELGKVSVAELKETQHPLNPSAPAAILFKKARTSFKYSHNNGFSTVHEYEYRIKIYNDLPYL